MTLNELLALHKSWFCRLEYNTNQISFDKFLHNKLLSRSTKDKIPKCLNCGICMPRIEDRSNESLYAEFCRLCQTEPVI